MFLNQLLTSVDNVLIVMLSSIKVTTTTVYAQPKPDLKFLEEGGVSFEG